MPGIPLFSFDGQRAGSLVFHGQDGLFYHIKNRRPNRRFVYMSCIHADSAQHNFCGGTAKVLHGGSILYHLKPHNHGPHLTYPLVCALKRDVIRRVKAGDPSPFKDIIQQEGQSYPLIVRAEVAGGSFASRLSTIRSNLRPKVPRTLGVLGGLLLLPQYEYLTKCLHVPDSLFAGFCGNMADQTLSLVFISPEMRVFMQTRSTVFGDGTERKLFRKPKASQIYTISAVWRYYVIPMMRAIMLRRTQAAYETLFVYLKQLMPNFNPSVVKCDFEDAQFNAWRIIFDPITVEGCLWHYDVAVYRMANTKLALHQLIKDEEEVASIVRSAGALPLLPADDIMNGLVDLGNEAVQKGWMPELRTFFKYMHKEWMPKVPILSVMDSDHRTNNASESSNRALNKEIKVSNPSCYQVIVYRMANTKLALHQLIKDEEEVASIVRSAGALPLLPADDIMNGLVDLGNEAVQKGWMPELRTFFKYMHKEWMPKVPILSVMDSDHRTNNASESSNRALNKEIKVSNPSCYQVIGAFVACNERVKCSRLRLD